MIFPWQSTLWKQLWRLNKDNRLPHALLFAGQPGIGKRQLALYFAHTVLCQNPDIHGTPCDQCHACHLFQAQSHPDFRMIAPEEGHAIKVDQIRQLSEFIQHTSHQGGYRVVVIQPATAMNIYAANALLKTLEEPTPKTLLILISDLKAALPVTIISRCQHIRFPTPLREEALSWLHLYTPASTETKDFWTPILDATHGAPLLAREWQQQDIWPLQQSFIRDLCSLSKQEADPLQLAMQWKDANMLWVFDLFFQWLLKLLWARESAMQLTELPPYSSTSQLLEFVEYLHCIRSELLEPYNLNPQLVLESLFIRWGRACSEGG